MPDGNLRKSLLRSRGTHSDGRVTYIELFFDLIFVFAITQLSHGLVEHLTVGGALKVALLFVAIWWVWIATSWVTNWLDPERMEVRLMLLVLMLAGLVMSISIPTAFEGDGLAFAGALVSVELGRSLFMIWALRKEASGSRRNFKRIISWQAVAALFWIAGALHGEEERLALWCVAIAITWVGPAAGFYVPGIGRSTSGDWDVDGGHMAERCSLFIIIALGESILATGVAFTEHPMTGWLAFISTFVGSAAMWWIYFDTGAERGSLKIASDVDPGRLARLAYTYLHLPIVAGIVVVAVGDELVLAHSHGAMTLSTAIVMIGGPALYIFGTLLFKTTIAGRAPLSHMIGLVLFFALSFVAMRLEPVILSVATMAILLQVAIWEAVVLRRDSEEPRVSIVP